MAADVRRARPWWRWVPPALVVVGLALVVGGSFGPWLVSGRRRRSSYELLQVADRLGFLGSGPGRVLPRTWVFVPMAAALALVALTTNRNIVAGTVAALVGVYALVLGVGVLVAPIDTGWGTALGAIGGSVATVGGLTLVISRPAPRSAQGETTP